MKWPKSTLYRERYYGSEEPFLMARKGYAMALTLRAKSNPCRPADEQKTTRRLTNPFAGVIFSSRTKALIPATHNRFITPKAKRRLINAQQQQRQLPPCFNPILKAPHEPGRHSLAKNPIGDRQ
jgi:hypothetical protein